MYRKEPSTDDELLSEAEFRRRYGGIGRTKLWEMRRDGKVRFVRISPKKLGFPVSELRRLIAEGMEGGHHA